MSPTIPARLTARGALILISDALPFRSSRIVFDCLTDHFAGSIIDECNSG